MDRFTTFICYKYSSKESSSDTPPPPPTKIRANFFQFLKVKREKKN